MHAHTCVCVCVCLVCVCVCQWLRFRNMQVCSSDLKHYTAYITVHMYKYIHIVHTAMHIKINVPEGSLSGVSALAVGAGGCGSGFGGFFIGSRTGFFLVGAGAAGLLGITGAWRRK